MLHATAVITAAGGCILAGCNGVARLRRRYAALTELCAAMQRMQLGLTHTNQTVSELLHACGERETRALFAGLAGAVAGGSTPLAAWETVGMKNALVQSALTQNDRKALLLFFSLLGGSDRCSQLKHVAATLSMLSMQCEEAKRTYEKNGRLYRAMGVLLGAGVAILLL